MPRALLPVQYVDREGTTITYQTVTSDDDAEFYNDGTCVLLARHATTGVTLNITFLIQQKVEGRSFFSKNAAIIPVATIANNATLNTLIGTFPVRIYNDVYGKVTVNLPANAAAVTTWKLAVISYI